METGRMAWILLNEKKGHRVMPDYNTGRGNTRWVSIQIRFMPWLRKSVVNE